MLDEMGSKVTDLYPSLRLWKKNKERCPEFTQDPHNLQVDGVDHLGVDLSNLSLQVCRFQCT